MARTITEFSESDNVAHRVGVAREPPCQEIVVLLSGEVLFRG